ncbi:MAG: hypothetical protein ACU85V_19450 [Gammaproteobacteria bacterium]
MSDDTTHWLDHPEHGELPARRLLDCVFALAPDGRILHFHTEQVDIDAGGAEVHYRPNGAPPAPERARCQIIPPFVTAFPRRESTA